MNNDNNKKEKTINFSFNLNIYWNIIKHYKISIIIILILAFFTQGIFVFEKFLFKIITDRGTDFTNQIINYNQFITILKIIGIVYLIGLIIHFFSKWIQLTIINKFETNIILDIKKMMFNHIINMDYNFHTSNKTGTLISRLIRGASAIERLSDVFIFNFAPLIIQLIIITISISYLDLLSAIILILIVAIFLLFSFNINKRQEKANMNANDAEDFEKAKISNYFTNIETIKYFGKEKKIKNDYLYSAKNTKVKTLEHWNHFRLLVSGQITIIGIGLFFMIFFSIKKLFSGDITLGSITFIYTTYMMFIGSLFSFDSGIRSFYRSMADLESLFRYYKKNKQVVDINNAKKMNIKDGTIEFKNVYFRYKEEYVFKNFNLIIPKGKKVALVGLSGSGKSTLIKLLYRFFDLDKGEIRIDNQDIKNYAQESLRSELSIVPQEAILFDDTLYNNIAFCKDDATEEEIMNAIRFAQLDQVVQNFKEKEHVIVGERGIKLSGGERQRVSIARAILADKKILILDEATSALDSKTEHDIQKDMKILMKGKTAIIIAHRLSTIMTADLIVVINKGKIIQTGTHKDLTRKEGVYKNLWSLQKGGYIN